MTNQRTYGPNIAHVRKYEPERLGKKGFVSIHNKPQAINVAEIVKLSTENEIDITKHGFDKVIGGGQLTKGIKIKAKAFTKKAIEKIEKAGGQAIILGEETTIKEKAPVETEVKPEESE